ncbi:MAG: hypothetical protein SGJ20_10410 [Planctomycetota bacterium]|nr:hypothetical protein [Planctomycetota bacterium]
MTRLFIASLVVAAFAVAGNRAEAQLPFSGAVPLRPAVSPYLNLVNNSNNNQGVSNYFTQVRPQIDARNEQIRQSMQIQRLQRDVSRAGTGGLPSGGSVEIRPTGHETFYNNTLNFFPPPAPRRQ